MCGCEPGFVCNRCEDTPQDWRWWDQDEPNELEPAAVEVGGAWTPWL